MRKTKPRLTLRETIESNRQALTFMAALAGKPQPVFDETLLKPKQVRAPAKPSIHPTEAQILKTILKYLRLHPRVAWVCRINSGTFAEDDRFIQSNSQRGMSDILGMMSGGKLFAIECKSRTGRLLPHQDDFLCLILQGGGLAGVARSIEDVDKILGFI
jgi:hypothetical protein